MLSATTAAVTAYTLLTFDVDGTLVRGSGQRHDASAHSRAFAAAVGQVLGDGQPTPLPADALPPSLVHGSTDGLICLNLANAALGIGTDVSAPRLPDVFRAMYEYCAALTDAQMVDGVEPLPGVLETLNALSARRESVVCGLVTGNVEGIARKKMRGVGVLATGALWPAAAEQTWDTEADASFLGGFGSDFCSMNIECATRQYLDRGEQIKIAARRAATLLPEGSTLRRVVHVGDAPADVLAARAVAEAGDLAGVVVGMVAVATGSYSADLLREKAGSRVEGKWEPVVLPDGMSDPSRFLAACGLAEDG